MKSVIAALLITFLSADPDIKTRSNLAIDQQHQLSTNGGILNPNLIIRLQAADYILIYLPDGTKFYGIVTKTKFQNKDYFECVGEIFNYKNAGFGFVLSSDGIFVGAIIFKDLNISYDLGYSEEAQGFVFIKKYKI